MRPAFLAAPLIAAAVVAFASVQLAAADDSSLDLDLGASGLHALVPQLMDLAVHTDGLVAISIGDLQTGHAIAINGGVNLPAASTIKIPVMVEVFKQIAAGRFTEGRAVMLLEQDRDCGYGSLCDAPSGSQFRVSDLLERMIDVSDNTATNMLIRLVGRSSINATMSSLGLTQTRLGDSIRSDGDIRALRTSADDMLRLLSLIAAKRVIDPQASGDMLALLAGQRHNTLLPALLPKGLVVAHKTGTLHDTLNDVGIVELAGAPYVICAFSTHLDDLDSGQRFIQRASLLTFESFRRAAIARADANGRL